MSMPSWMSEKIYIDGTPKPCTEADTISFDEEVLSQLDLPAAGPFGNCNALNLPRGRRLLYVRSFGYSIPCDGVRKPKGVNDWFFFLSEDNGSFRKLDLTAPGIDHRKVEDIRLFMQGGKIKAVGTYITTPNKCRNKHKAEIVIMSAKIKNNTIAFSLEYISGKDNALMPYQSPGEWQKNWMPLFDNPETFVQKIIPGKLYAYRPATGEMAGYSFNTTTSLFGGPPVLLHDGRYLMLCHRKDAKKVYNFILIETTKDFSITRHSGWFRFTSYPIEFCTHMEITGEDTIKFMYSVMDQMTYTTETSIGSLLNCSGTII